MEQGWIPPDYIHIRNDADLIQFIDFTSLESTDNTESIRAHCRKALSVAESGLPAPASVCVFPPFIKTVKNELHGSGIRVASVGAGFPSGQTALRVKLDEIRYIADEGADEVDVVFSRGLFLSGSFDLLYDELCTIREAARFLTMKVILETGELSDPVSIAQASELALRAGADFIKTSTGKIPAGASVEAVHIMTRVAMLYTAETKRKTGIKVSGGISDVATAWKYHDIVGQTAGEEWLHPETFRIGTSRLLEKLRIPG